MISYISFNDIAEEIELKYLPLVDDIYSLLHPDHTKAMKVFAKYVEDSARDFYEHYPATWTKTFGSGVSSGITYTFQDNFDAYIAGNIPEDQVELIPEAICRIASRWGHKTTANNFRYEKPNLTLMTGANEIKYFAFPPIRYKISPDGKFTEDSRVYFVDFNDDDKFKEVVAYNILTFLQMTRGSVAQPTGLNFFDYREILAELKQNIDTYYAVSASLYQMW